ncbi:MAG TPA: glycosyltransferase family 4 protein [Longimicrobiales bacterium]
MRIALVSTPFLSVPPRDYGGTELVVYELAEGLVDRGHEVTLFATGDSRTRAKLRWLYDRAQWPPDAYADLNHVAWAFEAAVKGGFDVIHAHSAAALALGRLAPALPLAYTLHHERVDEMSRFYRAFPGAWYIAISHDQASRETSLPKLEVIHHGLDPSRFEWRPTPSDYVCFVGRFARVKGPHTAIDAAERAGVPIRVAGEVHETDREFAEREVIPRLARRHVRYLGCIGTDVKVPLLRDARALLAPIEWNEPFGLILIEAMLSGCPVVAFPRGSVPELVEPGLTGFVVRNLEEMVEVIRPGGAVDRFDRRRCRERAIERFSRERMVRDHERLYERMVRERRDAGRMRALEPESRPREPAPAPFSLTV